MTWLLLLGGMLVWLAHFSAVYAISSIAVVLDASDTSERWGVAIVTALAALADIALLAVSAARAQRERRNDLPRFTTRAAALGAFISLLAVLWQGLPAIAFP
jgi:hypothetical protein